MTEPSLRLRRFVAIALAIWGVGVQLSDGIASLGMATCALGVLAVHARSLSWRSIQRWWPIAAFITWTLVTAIVSGHAPTWTGVARLFDFVGIPIAMLGLSMLERTERIQVAIPIAVVFAMSCAAAACQHFGWWPSETAFHSLGWTHIPFYRMYEPVPGDSQHFMAGGLLFHRLKLAHVGGLIVLWALALGLRGPTRARRWAFAIVAVGLLTVVVFTYARAADAALVLSIGVLLLLSLGARRAAVFGGAIVLLAIAAVALTPPLRQRFLSSSTSEGSGDRRAFLEAAGRAIAAHPFVGVGWGHFRPGLFAAPDTPPNVIAHPGKSHNQFVSMAAETGIPGALLFITLLIWVGLKMARDSPLGIAGSACLVFLVLLSLLHDPLFHSEVSMAVMLALGAGLARQAECLPEAST